MPSGGETRYDENGNPILGETMTEESGLKLKQFCFSDDPDHCVLAPEGGETKYNDDGNPILGSSDSSPM